MLGDRLTGRRVAFLATDGVLERDMARTWDSVRAAGAHTELVSISAGHIQAELDDGTRGLRLRVDREVRDVSSRDYDALVIPAGEKSADALAGNADVIRFVRGFMEQDKPVAAECDAPLLLVKADAVRGRTLAADPKIRGSIEQGGGQWADRPIERDQRLVTCTCSADIPSFCTALVDTIASAIEERSLDRTIEQSFPASDPPPGPTAI
jgi:protease I